MTNFKRSIPNFSEIAAFIAEEAMPPSDSFAAAFASNFDGVQIGRDEMQISTEMPDPVEAQHAVELIVTTVFDVLRDTRLESAAERIAWGIVHSFHRVAGQWQSQADKATRDVQDLLRSADPSEIFSVRLEEAQDSLILLDEGADALACMRDHAADVYHGETRRPWSAPKATMVSSKRTAAVIDGMAYLAARRQRRVAEHHPDGPLVVFSGGQCWADYRPIWKALDEMKRTRPTMLLLTTAQGKGGDAIAEAWAAKTKTPVVRLGIDTARWGKRAGFVRNGQIARLQPVDAVVAEGTGVQSQLVRVLRSVGIQPVLLSLYGGLEDWAR
ncbi:SLOG family protein [Sphingopyxis sp. 22461]|uniref:SLOG family protein n=1 Tax=Sphingopyxis sp. 22461 TaxID=3453923 RepID=UPI003F835E89